MSSVTHLGVINGYYITKVLGSGGEGRVVLAEKNGVKYAIKEQYSFTSDNEFTKLMEMDSPFVIKYFEHFVVDARLYVVLEYMPNGDLEKLIKIYKDTFIPETLIL